MLLFGIDSLVLPCETTQTIHGSPVGINWSEKELPSHFPILDFIKGLNSLRKRNEMRSYFSREGIIQKA
jgi:hypothetical protein